MGYMVSRDDGWRMPDWLWKRRAAAPERPSHPLGCHDPRVPDRDAMDAILLVLKTGMQSNALDATGPCSSSSAHRRFQEWRAAGVFEEFWRRGLARVRRAGWDRLVVPGRRRRDAEGAAGRAEDRPKSHRQSQGGAKRSVLSEGAGVPVVARSPGRQPQRSQAARRARWTRSRSSDRSRPQSSRRASAWTRPTTTPRCASLSAPTSSHHTSARAVRSSPRRFALPAGVPDAGSSRATHSWLNRNRGILIRWSKSRTRPPRTAATRQRPDRVQETVTTATPTALPAQVRKRSVGGDRRPSLGLRGIGGLARRAARCR